MDNLLRMALNRLLNQEPQAVRMHSGAARRHTCFIPEAILNSLPEFEEMQKALETLRVHWFELSTSQCKQFWDHDWYAGPGFYHAKGSTTLGPFLSEDEVIADAFMVYAGGNK